MRDVRIAERHFAVHHLPELNLEACLAIVAFGRWVRGGIFYGTAPGSNMAGKHFARWQTRCDSLHGWNIRAGWWPHPCVTMLLHTRPDRD